MNDRVGQLLTVALALTLAPGCSQEQESPVVANPPTVDEPQGRVESRSVVVTVVDRAEYDAALVSLQGQLVLVDCWATWCVPCLEALPHTFEFAKRYADSGLALMTLSFDDPSRAEQVEKLLASKGGTDVGQHFMSTHGGGSQSMEVFEIESGALPHYKLYDRTGKLRRTFELDPSADKQFTAEDVAAAVEQLLHEEVAATATSE